MVNNQKKPGKIKFILLLVILGSLFLILKSNSILAVNMESSRYRIQFGNVNIGAKNQSSTNYDLSTTLGQLAAGEFQSTGYVIKAGFQYLHSIIPFQFSISNINIDFGSLTPNSPATATTVLTVSFGGAGQYQVTAVEIGPLQTLSANSIPDTSCDGGANTCNETTAKPWTSNSAYGFGYNISGDDIPSDFIDTTYYRPFPDQTAAESPATIMSNPNLGKNRQATVTFKVNISPVQPAGSYQTIINFVATPSF